MRGRGMAVVGVILIVAAVLIVIASNRVCREADVVDVFKSIAHGNEMRMTMDILRYCGYAAGAAGVLCLSAGLFAKK